MIPEAIYQLGLAATILFIVLLILKAIGKIVASVLANNRDNDKDNTDVTKGLIGMIGSNTSVLIELRNYIDSDRKNTKETLAQLKLELLDRFGTSDRKVDVMIKMISEMQQSLDDTLLSPPEEAP